MENPTTSPAHKKIITGQCAVCSHFGSDCTGSDTAEHTPTPWALVSCIDGDFRVVDEQEITVATCWRQPQDPSEWAGGNAALIVRACNSHEELIEALDGLLQQTVDMDLAHGIELTEGERMARAVALSAIEKARGR